MTQQNDLYRVEAGWELEDFRLYDIRRLEELLPKNSRPYNYTVLKGGNRKFLYDRIKVLAGQFPLIKSSDEKIKVPAYNGLAGENTEDQISFTFFQQRSGTRGRYLALYQKKISCGRTSEVFQADARLGRDSEQQADERYLKVS